MLNCGDDVCPVLYLQELLQSYKAVERTVDGLCLQDDLVVGGSERVALIGVECGRVWRRPVPDGESGIGGVRLFAELYAVCSSMASSVRRVASSRMGL